MQKHQWQQQDADARNGCKFFQAVNPVGAPFGGSILNGIPDDAISAPPKAYSTTNPVLSFVGGGKSRGGNILILLEV